jgi:hypothetical protein
MLDLSLHATGSESLARSWPRRPGRTSGQALAGGSSSARTPADSPASSRRASAAYRSSASQA